MAVLSPPDLGADRGLDVPDAVRRSAGLQPETCRSSHVDDTSKRRCARSCSRSSSGRPRRSRSAITAGSRGIANIAAHPARLRRARSARSAATRSSCRRWAATAARPPTVSSTCWPATASPARRVGMPIVSSMDVQQIGCVDDMPVFMSTTALEADHVRSSTASSRTPTSAGASKAGWPRSARSASASSAARRRSTATARAAWPNSCRARRVHHRQDRQVPGRPGDPGKRRTTETADLQFVEPDGIGLRAGGRRCKTRARSLIGGLPFEALDVLIVDEMGKNISGTGMDTNVIGRMFVPGVAEEPRTADHGRGRARSDRGEPRQRGAASAWPISRPRAFCRRSTGTRRT